jgi:hypothetical protein
MKSNWREHSRKVIQRVLEETKGQDEKTIRKALTDAYPFGERAMHPYKIWLDEIKVQRKKRTFGVRPDIQNPDQKELF